MVLKKHSVRRVGILLVAALAVCLLTRGTYAYSVLTHEAIIDATWESDIKPLLLKRFPGTSDEDLRKAHGYAYGGAIIQDMGYYPLGSKFFSDLAHYVRSGDFVISLIRNSQDVDEYAFALGALCHYASDNNGHPIAINQSVPILFPKLGQRYGSSVTYEDNPSAHLRTEFGFDVIQVARGRYASEEYHDFIGFYVSKPLLERAFQETYGLDLKSIFNGLDLALGTYRYSVSQVIPEMTRVAWKSYEKEIEKTNPGIRRDRFLYSISVSTYRGEWGSQYQRPGVFASILAFLFRIVPKVGPFKTLRIKPSNPETEKLFLKSFETSTEAYKHLLAQVRDNDLQLENKDFDTGKPTRMGDYFMADNAYAVLLDKLADHKFKSVSPPLRQNILAYYGDQPAMPTGKKYDPKKWEKTKRELADLRAVSPNPSPAK